MLTTSHFSQTIAIPLMIGYQAMACMGEDSTVRSQYNTPSIHPPIHPWMDYNTVQYNTTLNLALQSLWQKIYLTTGPIAQVSSLGVSRTLTFVENLFCFKGPYCSSSEATRWHVCPINYIYLHQVFCLRKTCIHSCIWQCHFYKYSDIKVEYAILF